MCDTPVTVFFVVVPVVHIISPTSQNRGRMEDEDPGVRNNKSRLRQCSVLSSITTVVASVVDTSSRDRFDIDYLLYYVRRRM